MLVVIAREKEKREIEYIYIIFICKQNNQGKEDYY